MRLGTLRKGFQHDSIIGDMHWISIEVGLTKHEFPPADLVVPGGSFAI